MKLIEKEDYEKLPTLQQARFTEIGEIILGIVERAHEKADKLFKDKPQVSNEDIRKDWRYQLGYIKALHDISTLPDEAGKQLIKGG